MLGSYHCVYVERIRCRAENLLLPGHHPPSVTPSLSSRYSGAPKLGYAQPSAAAASFENPAVHPVEIDFEVTQDELNSRPTTGPHTRG